MAKSCKECGTAIGDKYQVCLDCNSKKKEKDPWANNGTTGELITAITKLNANVGSLVQILKQDPKKLKQIAEDMEKAGN